MYDINNTNNTNNMNGSANNSDNGAGGSLNSAGHISHSDNGGANPDNGYSGGNSYPNAGYGNGGYTGGTYAGGSADNRYAGNSYPNNTYPNHHTGSPYGEHSDRNYRYGSTYPQYSQVQPQNDGSGKHRKKKTAHTGYGKKALISVSLGLIFGLFAGAGFFGVRAVADKIGGTHEQTAVEAAGEAVSDSEAVSDGAESGTKETGGSAEQSGAAGNTAIKKTDNITAVVSDVTDVVDEVMPAIVSINNHYVERMSYFGQPFTQEEDATGSGIIVGQNDTELLVATNYHVIADAEQLTVQFVEGSEVEASVKGTDADMDLAVIAVPLDQMDKSTMNQIAVATLGDSDSLKVGEPAIAIGNALGYGQSVTTGVISALNRSIDLSDGSTGTFIQTDAAINPGNSGGALLNIKGEVIGINSNKIGGSTIEGMGYAIPISSASPIIAELMLKETKNKVAEDERGYLGISGISVTEYVSETYGMPEGVYVSQVYDNTAAAEAGLQKGDIITGLDGEKIGSMDELQAELEFYAKGQTVTLTVMSPANNGYESREVRLTLGNKVEN